MTCCMPTHWKKHLLGMDFSISSLSFLPTKYYFLKIKCPFDGYVYVHMQFQLQCHSLVTEFLMTIFCSMAMHRNRTNLFIGNRCKCACAMCIRLRKTVPTYQFLILTKKKKQMNQFTMRREVFINYVVLGLHLGCRTIFYGEKEIFNSISR